MKRRRSRMASGRKKDEEVGENEDGRKEIEKRKRGSEDRKGILKERGKKENE